MVSGFSSDLMLLRMPWICVGDLAKEKDKTRNQTKRIGKETVTSIERTETKNQKKTDQRKHPKPVSISLPAIFLQAESIPPVKVIGDDLQGQGSFVATRLEKALAIIIALGRLLTPETSLET